MDEDGVKPGVPPTTADELIKLVEFTVKVYHPAMAEDPTEAVAEAAGAVCPDRIDYQFAPNRVLALALGAAYADIFTFMTQVAADAYKAADKLGESEVSDAPEVEKIPPTSDLRPEDVRTY